MGRGKSADASKFWRRWDDLGIKDFTVTDAAERSGVKMPSSTISSYRVERRYPRANEAVIMARVGQTTVEYLETGAAPILVSPTDRDFLEKALRWKSLIERLDSLEPGYAEKVVDLVLATPRGSGDMVAGESPQAEIAQ